MIESVYKKIHYTGIIEVLINTTDKWVDFQINRVVEEHKIVLSFYITDESLYPEEIGYQKEIIDYIDMMDNFDHLKYMIYSNQCKDQIILMLIPRTLLMNKQDWKEYGCTL